MGIPLVKGALLRLQSQCQNGRDPVPPDQLLSPMISERCKTLTGEFEAALPLMDGLPHDLERNKVPASSQTRRFTPNSALRISRVFLKSTVGAGKRKRSAFRAIAERSRSGILRVENTTSGDAGYRKTFQPGSRRPEFETITRSGTGGSPRDTRSSRRSRLEIPRLVESVATVPRPAITASAPARISCRRALSDGDVKRGVKARVLVLPSAVMRK